MKEQKRHKTYINQRPRADVNPSLLVSTLHGNGLNTPNKRQRLTEWILKMLQLYAVYKRHTFTSNIKRTWKWKFGKWYTMQTVTKTEIKWLTSIRQKRGQDKDY